MPSAMEEQSPNHCTHREFPVLSLFTDNHWIFPKGTIVIQGHRDPDSLRAALSLGGEAPAWECSLGASFPSERALPAGGFGSVHTPSP